MLVQSDAMQLGAVTHHDGTLCDLMTPFLLLHCPQVPDPTDRHLVHPGLAGRAHKLEASPNLLGELLKDVLRPGVLLWSKVRRFLAQDESTRLVVQGSGDMPAVLEVVSWVSVYFHT